MKLTLFTAICALSLFAASCAHKESAEPQHSDVQVAIAASFDKTSIADSSVISATKTQTRATATAFQSGDLLGLYAVKSGGELSSTSNLINNHQLKVSASGEIVGGESPAYYPDKSSSIDLFSYYPYQSGNATADALGVLVGIRTLQTDFSSLQASDLCYGQKLSAAPSAAAHSLQFIHSFAQLRLNFSLYEGCSAISSVKLLSIKDRAKLNLQTGVVTLLDGTKEISAYANGATQFTAIVPAQSLSGPCVEITLSDGTIYYYHATTPIALQKSATNTLNLSLSDKGVLSLVGESAITAWGAVESSGTLGDEVNNLITLYWLAPHASYATIDKITVSVVDMFNNRREIDVTPTIDPLSSAEYATYTFPLILGEDAGYPQIVENIKLYAGSTLLRDSPREAIIGSVLSRAGAHTLGLRLTIEITPKEDWLNVSGYGESRAVTVTVGGGATSWTASVEGVGLTVSPTSGTSGRTVTLKWALHAADPAPATRSATVTFATTPVGATATIASTQNGVLDRININGTWWALTNAGSSTPEGYGTYHNWAAVMKVCTSLGSGWRVPTRAEFGTVSQYGPWTQLGGINGRWFGPNAASANSSTAIFFPAAGYRGYGSLNSVGTNGAYWSSTEYNSSRAYDLDFLSSYVDPQSTNDKTHGFSVRCVQ